MVWFIVWLACQINPGKVICLLVVMVSAILMQNLGVMRLMLEHWANCDEIAPEKKRYLLSRDDFDCLKLGNDEQTHSFSTDLPQKGAQFDLDSYRHSHFFSALTERISLIKQNKIHVRSSITYIQCRKTIFSKCVYQNQNITWETMNEDLKTLDSKNFWFNLCCHWGENFLVRWKLM